MVSVRRTLALLTLLGACVAAQGASFSVKDVTVALQESGGSVAKALEVAYPAKLSDVLALDHTLKLKVAFSVEAGGAPARPQQAFLRLTSAETGAAAYFAATKGGEGGGLVALATSAGVAKQLGTLQGGAFAAALLLGDAGAAAPLEWALGEVTVRHPPLEDGSQPAAGPARAVDSLYAPLPEIVHLHRKPEKRAPSAVALVFTAAAAAPLAALLAGLAAVGANVKGFPTGAGFVAAAGFHGGLAAVLGLYLLFWLRLNLAQAAALALALGTVTAGFSRFALPAGAPRAKQE